MSPHGDPDTVDDVIADTPPSWLAGLLAQRRPLVMGVLNVTPDSFSDGGRFIDPKLAIRQAQRMIAEGADIIDIGAESTRPYGGAEPVSSEEELARLAPVLPAVVKLKTPASIDTMKAGVAAWALDQGAAMVNDVWGLQRDPAMADIVSEHDMPVVIMHNREAADPAIDIIADVQAFFQRSHAQAERAGIARDCIVLDPGIGFGKTVAHNLALIARLSEIVALGRPVVIGTSRKSFLGKLTGRDVHQRLYATIATNVLAYERGARIFRVHDVGPLHDALTVTAATVS